MLFDEMFSYGILQLDNLSFVMDVDQLYSVSPFYFCYMLLDRILKNVGLVGINTPIV
jgi:hypothetical protein